MGDPSDILQPSEIEAIERLLTIRATMSSDEFVDYVSALRHSAKALLRHLRHLRALTALADGEALGLAMYAVQVGLPPTDRRVIEAWHDTAEQTRASYRATSLHLHAIGHAAGALSREVEVSALRSEIARWRSMFGATTPDEAHRAGSDKIRELNILIDDLTGQGGAALSVAAAIEAAREDGARVATAERDALEERLEEEIAGRDATIARLTAELEGARATLRDVDPQIQSVIDDRDAEIARLEKERSSARADGARVEREACAQLVHGAGMLNLGIVAAIRARGDR